VGNETHALVQDFYSLDSLLRQLQDCYKTDTNIHKIHRVKPSFSLVLGAMQGCQVAALPNDYLDIYNWFLIIVMEQTFQIRLFNIFLMHVKLKRRKKLNVFNEKPALVGNFKCPKL